MKPAFAILAILSLITAAPAVFAQAPKTPEAPKEAPAPAAVVKEADYAKALLGTWQQDIKDDDVSGTRVTVYMAAGKATTKLNLDAGGEKVDLNAKAKWSVAKDKLVIEITESSKPDLLPIGLKVTQTILSLSDKEFKYKDESSGKTVVEKRIEDEKAKPKPADK